MSEPLVTLDEIRDAAARIRAAVAQTPLLRVGNGRAARPFHLKCEHFQPMGAFKLRGAYNVLAQLGPEARAAGVITYSSGNHGQAVALSAQLLGMRAVVVMPETAPRVKVDGTRRYGAEVMFAGRTSDDRRVLAEAEAAAHGYAIVPPFDHRQIIAGAGTVGLEVVEGLAELSRIFVPVGGGGFCSFLEMCRKNFSTAVPFSTNISSNSRIWSNRRFTTRSGTQPCTRVISTSS